MVCGFQHNMSMNGHISAIVASRRRMLGLSQRELGERAALRREKINRFESQGAGISFEDLCRVLSALGYELIVAPAPRKQPAVLQPIWRSSSLLAYRPGSRSQRFSKRGWFDGSKGKIVDWGDIPA